MSDLTNVKAGDRLVTRRYSFDDGIHTVVKVSKTHVTLDDGVKFRLNGVQAGDTRYADRMARVATVADEEAFERKAILQKLATAAVMKDVTIKGLRRIIAIVEAKP